jgi:Trk K+ transport system NAD-binding subunit
VDCVIVHRLVEEQNCLQDWVSGQDCDGTFSRQAPIRSRCPSQTSNKGLSATHRQINAKARSQSSYGSDGQQKDSSILAVELLVPEQFDGKTISELKLRSHYGLNLLAFRQDGAININPHPQTQLRKGTAIVVIGASKNIDRLPI